MVLVPNFWLRGAWEMGSGGGGELADHPPRCFELCGLPGFPLGPPPPPVPVVTSPECPPGHHAQEALGLSGLRSPSLPPAALRPWEIASLTSGACGHLGTRWGLA